MDLCSTFTTRFEAGRNMDLCSTFTTHFEAGRDMDLCSTFNTRFEWKISNSLFLLCKGPGNGLMKYFYYTFCRRYMIYPPAAYVVTFAWLCSYAYSSDTYVYLAMDMLLKKDVGQSTNHATSNTPWVSGWPDLLHKPNINKTQCNFVNKAQIAVIFVPFN
jgi:hypothetical protein